MLEFTPEQQAAIQAACAQHLQDCRNYPESPDSSDGSAVSDDREPEDIAGLRAADLLQHQHTQPVAVNERLPGAEDCDEQGLCWLWERDCGYNGRKWALVDRAWALSQSDEDLSVYTHWLPANALPTPEA